MFQNNSYTKLTQVSFVAFAPPSVFHQNRKKSTSNLRLNGVLSTLCPDNTRGGECNIFEIPRGATLAKILMKYGVVEN